MDETRHYNAAIIGSGQGGNPLATAMAAAGHKTALIEGKNVGGTCVNEGCTPTKTMVASARVAHMARRASDYGVRAGSVSVDMARVRQRTANIVESFRNGSRSMLENTDGVDLLRGEARFAGPRMLEVRLKGGGTLRITADRIFVNTGTRPSVPAVEGLDTVPVLDNASIMELGEVPEHLLILCEGCVGLEFSQMFRRFGSKVTVLQRGRQLLPQEDADVAEAVTDILRQEGLEVLLNADALRANRTDGGIQLTVRVPEGERVLQGSHLLVATGTTPNTDRLNLTTAGVETDRRGFIEINEKLETNVPGVWALGDVTGSPAFTQVSYDGFRIITTNLIDGGSASIENRLVPYAVFIDPQLGRVGLSEREARERGLDIRVAKMPMNRVARAIEVDETRGFMKAVVDAQTDQILGVAVLGIEGGEVVSVLQMAMMVGIPYTAIRDGVFGHPTLAESLNNLFATQYFDREDAR
jgi:pyruvate/2-oxoglutarate dehydrogenase complex dihydrolipoamide dehydrogenase (E3) component